MHLKVRKADGERIRQKLSALGVLDHGRKIVSEEGFIFIPVTEAVSLPYTELVEAKDIVLPKKIKSIKEALVDKLTPKEASALPRSFDVIGDIAILELSDDLESKKKVIGDALLKTLKSIRVVAAKRTPVDTEYRLRRLEIIAGENRKETIHKEYGCIYKLNVESTYFSPRLGSERMRVVSQIKEGERVLVMFAGVGPYPILAAKKAKPKEVYAIELNPEAYRYLQENIRINKVDVKPILGDAKTEAKKLGKFDRIIMPLPKGAVDFLDPALNALNPLGIIHFYDFSSSENESKKKVTELCERLGYRINVINAVKCGSYAPDTFRICVDFQVT